MSRPAGVESSRPLLYICLLTFIYILYIFISIIIINVRLPTRFILWRPFSSNENARRRQDVSSRLRLWRDFIRTAA